jgi:hypothetical protein
MVDAFHATTQEQLIAALQSDASEIVVEGSPQFLRSVASVMDSALGTVIGQERAAPLLKPFLISFISFVVLYVVLPTTKVRGPVTNTDLTWQVVALVISILIFFLVRRAMAQDYDVEVSWKVTKYATGRLLLSKRRRRTTRTRKKDSNMH